MVDSLKKVAPDFPGSVGGRRYQVLAAAVLARAKLADSARHVLVRNRVGAEVDPAGDLLDMEIFVRGLLGDKDEAFRLMKAEIAANPEHDSGGDQGTGWWYRPLQSDPRWAELRHTAH